MTVRYRGRHHFDQLSADSYEGLGGILQNPGQDFFVSSNRGNNNMSGLNWGNPKAEIQAGMELAAEARYKGRGLCRIYVESGGYTGPILTPTNADCPFGALIGVNNNGFGFGPWLAPLTGAGHILTVRARGWLISGFEFDCPATGTGLILDKKTASANPDYAVITKCLFTGGNARRAIDFKEAVLFVKILDNIFDGIYNAGGTAEAIGSSTHAIIPRIIDIIGNRFQNNDKHISMGGGYLNEAIIEENYLLDGILKTPTIFCDLRSGNVNVVRRNVFAGTYSHDGGYREGLRDIWVENYDHATMDLLTALPV